MTNPCTEIEPLQSLVFDQNGFPRFEPQTELKIKMRSDIVDKYFAVSKNFLFKTDSYKVVYPIKNNPMHPTFLTDPSLRRILYFSMEDLGSSYGLDYPVGDDMNAAIEWARRAATTFEQIEEFRERHLNLICRGSSGAILASLFAASVRNTTKVVHIKKPGESSHSSNYRIGEKIMRSGQVNVIIDDFISSGATFDAIFETIGLPRVHCIIASNISKFERYQCNYAISIE